MAPRPAPRSCAPSAAVLVVLAGRPPVDRSLSGQVLKDSIPVISTASEAGADASLCRGIDRPASRLFVCSQQARKSCLLQNHPFGEAPGAAASLILEVDPMHPRTRMSKSVPKHRQIVAIRAKPHDMPDADSIRIAALKPVCDAERRALALARATQEALVPSARRQLIPDEGGYAA